MSNADVKFKYLFNKDYDPCYVNGAYGGFSPTGELVVNFYLERVPLPYEEKYAVNEEGQLDDSEVVSPEEYKFIRSIQTGVVMSKETAKIIAEWINIQIAEEEEEQNE